MANTTLDNEGIALKMKRIAVVLMCAVLCLMLCGCKSSDYKKAKALYEAGDFDGAIAAFSALGDYKDSAALLAQAESAAALLRLDEAHKDLIGYLFTFGSYAGEAVNWRALDVRDGRILFLCDDCLDRLPIDTGEGDFTWAGCTLRAWLNGEFLEKTFDDAARSAIVEVETYEGVFDRVLLLDYSEAKQYCEYEPAKDDWWWWLREENYANEWNGYTHRLSRDSAPGDPSGVRPAFWMDLRSEGFRSGILTLERRPTAFSIDRLITAMNAQDGPKPGGAGEKIVVYRENSARYQSILTSKPAQALPLPMQSISSADEIGYVFSCRDLDEDKIVNRSYLPGGNVELHLRNCEIRALRANTGEVLASQTVTADIPTSISVEYRMQNGVVLNPEAGKTYTAEVDSDQYTSAYMALCEAIGIPWEE